MTRLCPYCPEGIRNPLSPYQKRCVTCQAAHRKAYHPTYLRKREQNMTDANKDRRAEKLSAYRARFRDEINARRRAYRLANIEAFRVKERAYIASHREQIRENKRRWQERKKAM